MSNTNTRIYFKEQNYNSPQMYNKQNYPVELYAFEDYFDNMSAQTIDTYTYVYVICNTNI